MIEAWKKNNIDYDLFVCWKVIFIWKVNFKKMNFGKVNYFPIFGSVMKNKLENTLQYLVISRKMS